MNKQFISIILPFNIILLANWGTSESNSNHRAKPAVNFSGEITTSEGKETIQVKNITINRKYRDITVYDTPSEEWIENGKESVEEDQDNQQKKYKILSKHPKNILPTTKLDLSEISTIEVQHDNEDWMYKIAKRGTGIIFVEIIATYQDHEKTQKYYLVEETVKVYCDEENDAGAIEKVIPIKAIDSILFEGCSEQKEENNKTTKRKICKIK